MLYRGGARALGKLCRPQFRVRVLQLTTRSRLLGSQHSSTTTSIWTRNQKFGFHTLTQHRAASPTADALMESINDLYATAKDEFEMAAEETEKKTIYAADDREAAHDAFKMLKEGFENAVSQSDPEVAKEVQSRVGSRIRELENALKAMDEMAMED